MMPARPPDSAPRPVSVPAHPARPASRYRRWTRIALFVGVVIGIQLAGSWLGSLLQIEIWPRHSPMLDLVAVLIIVAYVFTMALPFVPGIEIGLAVMLVFGAESIPAIYLCTQAALLLSFAVGRFVPLGVLTAFTGWLHLFRAQALLRRLEPLPSDRRLALLLERAPHRSVEQLVRYRYLALALLINLPGNAIIGGAGGIGLIAGMSRVFSLPRYVLVMAIATTPVPIVLWLADLR